MQLDTSVFDKVRNFQDYQQAEQEFQLRKQIQAQKIQQAQAGNDLPAALQIANEYAKARASGDIQRMNDIALAAKSFDRGVAYGDGGGVKALPGYGDAVGSIEGAKSGYKQQAEKNVDLNMNPKIKKEEAYSSEVGKQQGETASDLNAASAAMPQLEQAVSTLSDLGKKATYTTAGRVANTMVRETGQGATEGAKARAAYIAHVKNNVLPLLRRTFGAQFTKAEGDNLLATLGDPNSSPEEKDATLNAFISDKKATLETMRRQNGGLNSPQGGEVPLSTQPREAVRKLYSPSTGKTKIIYSDGSEEVLGGK